MLRIGKNTNETEQPDKQEGSAYGTAPRTHTPPYQAADTQIRPSPDVTGSSRALTESESLARDIKELIKSGYKLERVTPFDMFPQTAHCEAVAELTRL